MCGGGEGSVALVIPGCVFGNRILVPIRVRGLLSRVFVSEKCGVLYTVL